jgi:hypothetical protein
VTITIRCNGPEAEARTAALARAAELGYTDPRIVRVLSVHGLRANLLAVVVADGEEDVAVPTPRRKAH